MSWDVTIWHGDQAFTQAQATAFANRLYAHAVVVGPSPDFDGFWSELQAKYPNPAADSARNASARCPPLIYLIPRSMADAAPGDLACVKEALPAVPSAMKPVWWTFSVGPSAVVINIDDQAAVSVAPIIVSMAAKHGLTVLDGGRLAFAPSPGAGKAASNPDLVLTIIGAPGKLQAQIKLGDRMLLVRPIASRSEGHAAARKVALQHGLDFYKVVDPALPIQRIDSALGPDH